MIHFFNSLGQRLIHGAAKDFWLLCAHPRDLCPLVLLALTVCLLLLCSACRFVNRRLQSHYVQLTWEHIQHDFWTEPIYPICVRYCWAWKHSIEKALGGGGGGGRGSSFSDGLEFLLAPSATLEMGFSSTQKWVTRKVLTALEWNWKHW